MKSVSSIPSINDALIMHDITNIGQNPHMSNTSQKPSKYDPSCDLSMTLRTRTPIKYTKTCNRLKKIYANNRYDKKYINNKKQRRRKRQKFEDKENITTKTPPKKKRKRNKNWGNKTKQSNPTRAIIQQQNEQQKQQQIDKNITILENKINDLITSKMNVSDHRLIE
eukprot:80769_1